MAPFSLYGALVRGAGIDDCWQLGSKNVSTAGQNPERSNQGSFAVWENGRISKIFNPQVEYTVNVEKLVSKSKNSPYHGYPVTGKVVATIVNGKIVVRNGELTV